MNTQNISAKILMEFNTLKSARVVTLRSIFDNPDCIDVNNVLARLIRYTFTTTGNCAGTIIRYSSIEDNSWYIYIDGD